MSRTSGMITSAGIIFLLVVSGAAWGADGVREKVCAGSGKAAPAGCPIRTCGGCEIGGLLTGRPIRVDRKRGQDSSAVGRGQWQGTAPLRGTHSWGVLSGFLPGRSFRANRQLGQDGAALGRGERGRTVPFHGPHRSGVLGVLLPTWPSRVDRQLGQDGAALGHG